MTARQYAKECGVEIVGKLRKVTKESRKWNAYKGEEVVVKSVYWVDDAGTEINGTRSGGWCLTTSDGTVY